MNEEMLRAMIRQSIARLQGSETPGAAAPLPFLHGLSADHPSHYRYALPESDGPCLIEPAVQCTHCGYCQSHGH